MSKRKLQKFGEEVGKSKMTFIPTKPATILEQINQVLKKPVQEQQPGGQEKQISSGPQEVKQGSSATDSTA